MKFYGDKQVNPRQGELAYLNTHKQHSNEATLNPTALGKQEVRGAIAQDQQHESPAFTQKISTEDSPAQYQQDVSTATTLEEGRPLQQWNHPRINVGRSLVAFYGLVIMGANDAAYGVS